MVPQGWRGVNFGTPALSPVLCLTSARHVGQVDCRAVHSEMHEKQNLGIGFWVCVGVRHKKSWRGVANSDSRGRGSTPPRYAPLQPSPAAQRISVHFVSRLTSGRKCHRARRFPPPCRPPDRCRTTPPSLATIGLVAQRCKLLATCSMRRGSWRSNSYGGLCDREPPPGEGRTSLTPPHASRSHRMWVGNEREEVLRTGVWSQDDEFCKTLCPFFSARPV